MTSPLNSTSSLTGSAASAASASSAASAASAASSAMLNQNDFLQLLMAQMQNQDPLQPTDGTEFVTQLAQFSQVQQAVAQTTALGNISTQIAGLSNSNDTALIGKTVTVQNQTLSWNGNFAATSNVTLSGPAQQVTASIQDSQGNVVRTMNLGAEPGGVLPVTWNGATDAGQAAPAGSYTLNVTATDANGQSVNVSTAISGVVTQVSFNQGTPTITLSSGAVAPVSNLVSVGAAATTPTNP
jgi:flagellar basal-body rod modification protein FlgD